MLVTRLRLIAAATGAVLLALTAPPVEAQPDDLFTPVNETPPSGPLADITLRSRVVTVDLGQLDRAQAAVADPPAPGTTLTLNLFDDTVVTGLVERTAPTFSGGYAVAGRLVEEPLGTMTLVVNGETVAGTVRLSGEIYHIRSVGDGLYAVSEVEEPPLDCGVGEPHSETDHPH